MEKDKYIHYIVQYLINEEGEPNLSSFMTTLKDVDFDEYIRTALDKEKVAICKELIEKAKLAKQSRNK